MKSLWLAAAVAALAGCSAQEDGSAPVSNSTTAADGTTRIAVDSDTLVDGRRPKLVLLCAAGRPPGLELDFVRAPSSPPPPRQVFAQIQVKGAPEVTIEFSHIGDARWRARLPDSAVPASNADDRENQRRLLPLLFAFTRERQLAITPPATYGPAERMLWDPGTLGEHLSAAQACAYEERPTI